MSFQHILAEEDLESLRAEIAFHRAAARIWKDRAIVWRRRAKAVHAALVAPPGANEPNRVAVRTEPKAWGWCGLCGTHGSAHDKSPHAFVERAPPCATPPDGGDWMTPPLPSTIKEPLTRGRFRELSERLSPAPVADEPDAPDATPREGARVCWCDPCGTHHYGVPCEPCPECRGSRFAEDVDGNQSEEKCLACMGYGRATPPEGEER